jgi:SAM-dependent methyltransferase
MQKPWEERLVHYQYIEELLESRRVLEIGCGSGAGAAFLGDRARRVVSVVTEAESVSEELRAIALAKPNVEFVVSEADKIKVKDHAFDLVLIPELERFATRGTFIPEILRVLAPNGVALFSVRSGDGGRTGGMALQDLHEYLGQSFRHVRMVGEIPFTGYTVADFEPGEIEPQIDGSLVEEDEAPLRYLALCSQYAVVRIGYTLLQTPVPVSPFERESRLERLAEERAEAELEIERLTSQLEDAERKVLEAGSTNRQELKNLRAELREKQTQVESLTQELGQVRIALEEVLAELDQRGARGAVGPREPRPGPRDTAPPDLEAARKQAEASEARLDMELRRVGELEKRLERETARADALELRLQRERDRQDRERDRAEEAVKKYLEERSRAEVEHVRSAVAERALEESREAVDQQRQRAEQAERRSDGLSIRIEEAAAEQSALHGRLAELQGARQAAEWRVDELLGKLRDLESQKKSARPPDEPMESKAISRELNASRGKILELEAELEEARELVRRAPEEAEAKAGGLKTQLGSLQAKHEETEARAAAAEIRAASLAQEADKHARQVADLEKELMKSESRVVEQSRKATNAESRIVQLEVKLKRSESEASTLSKWAEELREELKEAQGKTSVKPITPEPEVAALRNDLREARERIGELEARCDRFMHESNAAKAAVEEKAAKLDEAVRSANGTLLAELEELRGYRSFTHELEAARARIRELERELEGTEDKLRDVEQAQTELGRTRRELQELRSRMHEVDSDSEELEGLRLRARRFQAAEEEAERLRAEVEEARIALARAQEELRGGTVFPEEASWKPLPEEEPDDELEAEGYVGEEMVDGGIAHGLAREEDEDEGEGEDWLVSEELRVRERQLEALLEGAAVHREEMERLKIQVREMDALVQELQAERDELERLLGECNAGRYEERRLHEQMRDDSLRLGREVARVKGRLQRCEEERVRLLAGGGATAVAGTPPAGPFAAPRPSAAEEEGGSGDPAKDEPGKGPSGTDGAA